VCAHDLIDVLREKKVANLTSCLNAVEVAVEVCAPKSDTFILSPSSTHKEAVLVRRPADGFHSCLMAFENAQRV